MTLSYPPILTTQEVQEATVRLHNAMQTIHTSPDLLQKHLQENLSQLEYNVLAAMTAQNEPSPNVLTSIITATISELETRPVLELHIGFEPSHAFVANIHRWLEQHGPIPCQVLWQVNPENVGGLLIGWQGKRYDYSLATKLNSYEQFPEIS